MIALLFLLAQAAQTTEPWGIKIGAGLATLVVGTVLPLLVGLITKYEAHPGLKAVLLALFAAIGGLIVNSALDDGSSFISKQGVILAASAFLIAVGMHFGFWKPTTVARKVGQTPGALG